MEQRTDDWEKWRRQGIGASDAPIIMGVSPWTTRKQLWEQKLGISPPFKGNWATERGNRLEPVARAAYELEFARDMPPRLVEHKDHPWMRASLDGFNEIDNIVLEIKIPGKKSHECAKKGKIPDCYYAQVQHQLFVTGAKEAHYYSYYNTAPKDCPEVWEGVNVVTTIDEEYCKKLFELEKEFWECVQSKTPPKILLLHQPPTDVQDSQKSR